MLHQWFLMPLFYLMKTDTVFLELGIDSEVSLLEEIVYSQIGDVFPGTIGDQVPKEIQTRQVHAFHSLE